MGHAISGGPYVFTSFSGAIKREFLDGLLYALRAANWELVETTAAGYKLRGRSPQVNGARTVGLWIHDNGDPVAAIVQFFSDVDSQILGYAHRLKCAAGFTYQVVANPCQFFLSRPGVHADVHGSAVCGGVPFITDDPCTEMRDGTLVSEMWWSMGDGQYHPFFWSSNPRGNLLRNEYHHGAAGISTWASEACVDGHYVTPGWGPGAPHILCLTGPCDIDEIEYLNQTFSPILYWNDTSLDQEPMLAWGDTAGVAPRVRGQVWDAVIKTPAAPMDLTASFDGYDWINYTDNFFYGALYLITGGSAAAPQESDYAY